MNIVPVYFDLRITGKGVNVIVPDDGLDWRHLDIYPKYVSSELFFRLNSIMITLVVESNRKPDTVRDPS